MLHNTNYISFFSAILILFCVYNTKGQNQLKEQKRNLADSHVIAPLNKIFPFEDKKEEITNQTGITNQTNEESYVSNPILQDNISIDEIRNVKPLYTDNNTILFYLYLIMVLMVGFVKAGYAGYLTIIQRSVFNAQLAQQFHRSSGAQLVKPFSLLFVFNLLVISTLLYLVTQNFSDYIFTAPLQHFLLILLVVAAYHIFKLFINHFLSAIFKIKNTLNFYQFNFFLTEVAICIVIIPLLMLATFNAAFSTKALLLICLAIFIIGHLFAYLKGISSSLKLIVFHKFYFFLYFCILEIGPFVVLYKIMDNWLMLG